MFDAIHPTSHFQSWSRLVANELLMTFCVQKNLRPKQKILHQWDPMGEEVPIVIVCCVECLKNDL